MSNVASMLDSHNKSFQSFTNAEITNVKLLKPPVNHTASTVAVSKAEFSCSSLKESRYMYFQRYPKVTLIHDLSQKTS